MTILQIGETYYDNLRSLSLINVKATIIRNLDNTLLHIREGCNWNLAEV